MEFYNMRMAIEKCSSNIIITLGNNDKLYVLSIIRLLPSKLLTFFNFFFDKPIVSII